MLRLSVIALILFVPGPAGAQGTTMVPVTVDGQSVQFKMRIYRPAERDRLPTLVFNHGSTGNNWSLIAREPDAPEVASYFVERGWAVVMPFRRGRGGSEGSYDEGLNGMRTAYTCETGHSLAGADRALRDIAAAMQAILAMDFVDPARVVIGGQSRGGILSMAYAGMRPDQVKGVLNFVGGWVAARCSNATTINQSLFKRGVGFRSMTLWLYGDLDTFYPLSHSRENFQAFMAAGGKGTFHEFAPPPGRNGHLIFLNSATWSSQVDAYLASLNPRPPQSRRGPPAKQR